MSDSQLSTQVATSVAQAIRDKASQSSDHKHHKPWIHRPPAGWNQTATGSDFAYMGEVYVLLKVAIIIAAMAMCIVIGRHFEKRQRLAQQRKNGSILSDTEQARAPEMDEMNPAAAEAAAVEAGDVELMSAQAPGADGMAAVREELEKLRLSDYADAFEQNGYDLWQEILRLPPARLAKLIEVVGMSENHADRFKEQIHNQRRQRGIGRAPTTGDTAVEDSCVIL